MRVDYSGTMTNTRRRHDPTFDVKVLCWPDPQCFSRFRVASDNRVNEHGKVIASMARVSTETTWNDHFLLVCANLLQWRYNTIKFNQIYSCDIRGCSIPIVISAVSQTIMVMMTMTVRWLLEFLTHFFVKHHWGCFLVTTHWRLWQKITFKKNTDID